jgi:hypothetical protein
MTRHDQNYVEASGNINKARVLDKEKGKGKEERLEKTDGIYYTKR